MYESMLKKGIPREKILMTVHIIRDTLIENQNNIELFDGIGKAINKLSRENKRDMHRGTIPREKKYWLFRGNYRVGRR